MLLRTSWVWRVMRFWTVLLTRNLHHCFGNWETFLVPVWIVLLWDICGLVSSLLKILLLLVSFIERPIETALLRLLALPFLALSLQIFNSEPLPFNFLGQVKSFLLEKRALLAKWVDLSLIHMGNNLVVLGFVGSLLDLNLLLLLTLSGILVRLGRPLALDKPGLLVPLLLLDGWLLGVDGHLLDVVLDGWEGGLVGDVDARVSLGLAGLNAHMHSCLVDALILMSASLRSPVPACHGRGLVVLRALHWSLTQVQLLLSRVVLGFVEHVLWVHWIMSGCWLVACSSFWVVVGLGDLAYLFNCWGFIGRKRGHIFSFALFLLFFRLLGYRSLLWLRHVILLGLNRLGLFKSGSQAWGCVGQSWI